VGCVFTKQIVVCSKEECLELLKKKSIAVFTTSLKAAKNYLDVDYKKPSAFVVGTEAEGVDVFWEDNSDAKHYHSDAWTKRFAERFKCCSGGAL
jgi:TrmH family RNA methyltransferase